MFVDPSQLPQSIDLAIIGAGPQALTLVTHLLQKQKRLRDRFLVFDPSGTWMSQWQQQFAALDIPHLRSPAVHQPDPNPHALRTFAEARPQELFAPYDLPGTRLFGDFCHSVVARWQLQHCVYPAQVVQIEPQTLTQKGQRQTGQRRSRFCLTLSTGQSIAARRVVLATGGGAPHMPEWVAQIPQDYPRDRLLHASQVDLRGLQLRGERVLIIGGGLTSGHLAVGAIERGAQVLLMSRRQLYEKLFDADPGWLGPKYLKDFWAEPDWLQRWQLIQQARNGGSLTPAMLTRLRRLQREDRITFYEHCQVAAARWQQGAWQICCTNKTAHDCIQHQSIDRIWLATGSQLDATQHPLLQSILAAYPTAIVNGLPVLDQCLRWQGCNLFLMGGFAALQVGPTARNLSGARAASDRIVPALTKASLAIAS